MIDLSSISGMFPSLSSLFSQQGLDAISKVRAEPEETLQNNGSEPSDQDSVELSDPARRPIPTGTASASFDKPGKPESITVAEDGTYVPTVQTTRRLSMSFNFEFNLSIRRAVTAVAREPHVIDRAASSSSARLSALESRSLYYQSILNESRGLVAAGYAESRTIQTKLFYSRTRELSLSLPVSRAEQFEQTRARVTRSFQLSISMDFSFLAQFTRQSETISSLDDDLFGRYLDNTDGLSNHSSKVLQSFFDDVDRILEESEVFVALSLSSFFGQVADHFGLNAEAAAMLEGMVMDEVKAFFDDVENFLSEARAAFSGPADPTIPLEASTPREDTTEEEDPAVLLV